MNKSCVNVYRMAIVTDSKIIGVQFSIMSPSDIRKSSVAEITSRDTFVGGKAVVGGMFDTRMGPIEPGVLCPTDGLDHIQCPGYFGHIELAKPVFYMQYLDSVIGIIRCICIKCSKLLIDKNKHKHLLSLSNERRWKQVQSLCSKVECCGEASETGCGCKQPDKYKLDGFATVLAEWKKSSSVTLKVTPEMFIKIFRRITNEDIHFLGFSPTWSRPEWMICQVLAIPPPAVRPSVRFDASKSSEDDLTYITVQIEKANRTLRERIAAGAPTANIDDYHSVLQYFVATLVDNKIPNAKPAAQRSGRPFKTIKDRLNGKTGRVRGNLMGKRVDFSARSVITPDPNLSIQELGVPLKIAMNITRPVVVNRRNIAILTKLLKNGPDEYPGAKLLERKVNGQFVNISLKYADRESLQLHEGDILHRHMLDGDGVLFNRQPTLHRMSMMCHLVRVMRQGNTFRMNVGCTKPYNADFDGDEMNMHMPQSSPAEVELKTLAAVPFQIISPAANQSIVGVFQDSLLGTFQFTQEHVTFDPLTAMNLAVGLKKVDASIFKQASIKNFDLLTQILPPISSFQKNKLFKDEEDVKTSNNVVQIVNGKYLRGRIDKGVLASTSKGLLQRLYNDYDPYTSATFIDELQYIINAYMKRVSYSVGVSDLIVNEEVRGKIKDAMRTKKDEVLRLIQRTHMDMFENNSGTTNVDELELQINSLLNEANSDAGKQAKKGLDTFNRFSIMVNAGSKGSDINVNQMVACLGQQQIEGKRIPYGFDQRTLPHFSKYDDSPEARGFIDSSFIEGLTPTEVFFHAMGGRIGLIDTAVKTSTTGYIQRRLVKSMEDDVSMYDGTVRNNKNKIIQFSYGDDNMDSCKIEFQNISLPEMKTEQVYNHYYMDYELGLFTEEASRRMKTQHTACVAKSKLWTDFMLDARDMLIHNIFDRRSETKLQSPVGFTYLIANVEHQMNVNKQIKVDMTPLEAYDLLDDYFSQLNALGAYKPTYLFKIMYYYFLSPKELLLIKHFTQSTLTLLLEQIVLQYKRAIINPGETVGIISAQSIGEPTTQMTLNTFHFAGVASKSNVTRGVPRIEEILSLTQYPRKPSVTVYLTPIEEQDKSMVILYKSMIVNTKLQDIVEKVDICYDPSNTVNEYDRGFIRDTQDIQDLMEDCGTRTTKSDPSPWVIRVKLNQEEMLNKKITMDDVNFAIKVNSYFGTMECMYSDYNAEQLVFRITVDMKKVMESKSAFMESDSIYKLKEIQMKLLNVVIRGVKNIQNANIRTIKNYMVKESGNYVPKDIWVLDTIGTNLLDCLALNYIDSTRTYSNDIKEMYDVLGIEAARNSIHSELTEVIESDGVYINDHHKTLLCDRMTCTTPMTSIFRHGVNKDDIGPIAKASFEETPEMFLQAARHAEMDNMRGVSANVMCGQEGYYGTSAFDVLLDLEKMNGMEVFMPSEEVVDMETVLTKCDSIKIHNNIGHLQQTEVAEVDYLMPF